MVRTGLVACFAGKIGSGKTTVTTALAQCLNWRRVGFGDYLRWEVARRGGDPEGRVELQDLGRSLVESDPRALCEAVLRMGRFCPGDDLLVDGIRHAAAYRALVDIVSPSRPCLFYLHAHGEVRRLRATGRGEAASTSVGSHPVEAELTATILDMADVVVDAGEPLGDVICRCVDGLRTRGVDSKLLASCTRYAERI